MEPAIPTMTLEELLLKVPKEYRPVIRDYGPALLKMIAEQNVWPWVDKLIVGDLAGAYAELIAASSNPTTFNEAAKLKTDWQVLNAKNKAGVALQRQAVEAILRIVLYGLFAAVRL